MWQTGKTYLKLAAYFGVGYWVLTRWGEFTEKQAIILALIVAALLNSIIAVAKHCEREKFEPFSLTFAPKWHAILVENRVVAFDQFEQAYACERKAGFRAIFEDFRLTRLSPRLWFFNNYNMFRGTLDINHSLDELLTPEEREKPLAFAPRLYFKETSDKHPKLGLLRCIEFGLVTPESFKRSVDWRDDRCNIPLGKFPDAVFNGYYAGENFSLNEKVSDKEISAVLQHYGWEKEERDFESPFRAEVFKHKCMTVYLDGIE